jgi:CDP-4-dehydro-6-deoxyglucose reductase, E1
MVSLPHIRVPLNVNTMTHEEIDAAKAVLDSGALTMGARCREFEAAFAKYIGVKHAIMVNSGSSANLLATFTLANPLCPLESGRRRIEPGSEVIVPALTWSTTVWPFIQAGAIPVFVDCDPLTLQMQPEAIEAAITPRTSAIAIVHVLGGAVDVPAVRRIADQHGLWLFEDTCESLGVLWDKQQVGSFGHLASFSFYFAHHITTIEGGMVVTDDDALADLMRAVRAHGWVRHMESADTYAAANPDIDPRFLFITTGFNLRPTEINAAIGLVQLKKLDGFNESRRSIAQRLDDGLASLRARGSILPMAFDQRCHPAPFGYPVLCRSPEERNGLQKFLEARGVETRPVICGNLARQPALRHFEHRVSGDLSGANRVMDCGLYWGTHPMMGDEDIQFILKSVEEYFA